MRWDFGNSGISVPEEGEPIEETVMENGKRVKGLRQNSEQEAKNSCERTKPRHARWYPILRSKETVGYY
jgi:hypothetical protein